MVLFLFVPVYEGGPEPTTAPVASCMSSSRTITLGLPCVVLGSYHPVDTAGASCTYPFPRRIVPP